MKPAMMAAVCAAAMALAPISSVRAQDMSAQVEEVVVTGSRMVDWDPDDIPAVQVVRRADNLIVTIKIVCDTRDDSERARELRETMKNLARAATASPSIELGLGDDVVGRFDESNLDALIKPETGRAQVSYAVVVVKTPISPTDGFDAATGRLKSFIDGVRTVGRTEVLITGDWELTIKGPDRYRADIVAAIGADARATAAAFGPAYAVQAEGLDNRVTWRQAGPLDLALFIPYKLAVLPKG